MEMLHIEQELVTHAEPHRVFEALTTGVDAWWMKGFESPQSTFHLEPVAGGRFYEDFGQGRGSALFATVTYLEPGKKLRMMGPMGMSGPVMGTIAFDLVPQEDGTRLKLSHRVMGAVGDDDRETYTHGWQELLTEHLKGLVEEHQGYRKG